MKSKSLRQAIKIILESIEDSDINLQDKVELMINLRMFLNETKYKENIDILQERECERKYERIK